MVGLGGRIDWPRPPAPLRKGFRPRGEVEPFRKNRFDLSRDRVGDGPSRFRAMAGQRSFVGFAIALDERLLPVAP